jgi:hypothetical protein
LNTKILDYLSGVSLADIVNSQQDKENGAIVFAKRNPHNSDKAVVNG